MRFFNKNSCAAPLARFIAGLYALIICFRAHCCVVACIPIFISAFFRNCVFERWIILSFCKINWEISVAVFFLVEMTVFWGIFDMCRAKFWGDLFIVCFDFYHCMCNSVVALFFAMILCTACLILRPNSSLLCVFVVCTFASVSLARLAQSFPVIFCFLLCSGVLAYIILATATCFVVIVKFFSDFVDRVRACLFWL